MPLDKKEKWGIIYIMRKYNDIIQVHIEGDILKDYDNIKKNPAPFIWRIMCKETIYLDEATERVGQAFAEIREDNALDTI